MSTSEELGPYSFDLDNHEEYVNKRKSKKKEEPKKKAPKNLTLKIPMREVPPVVDAKGEFTEEQVLGEGEIFDPDQFLDELDKHTSEPILCPRHMIPMRYNSIIKPD